MTIQSPVERGSLRLRLIGKCNGVGLSRDVELLRKGLSVNGHTVSLQECERPERKGRRSPWRRLSARLRRWRTPVRSRDSVQWDANIMLEHVWPQFLHQAQRNVLIPNPEWFDRRDLGFLSAIDRVWAKTALAEHLFRARGCNVSRIGFDSEDRLVSTVARRPQFLHIAGRSRLKGTERLLLIWAQHPEWPLLTVVQDRAASSADAAAANIHIRSEFLADEALRTLQNEHRFHLCLSEAEGWGHYIVEALSVGAVVLATDAPPMNELVTAKRGILVAAHPGQRQNLVRLAHFDDMALQSAVETAVAMPANEAAAMGVAARAWFIGNRQYFHQRLRTAVDQL